jgi:hypothetical protein
VTGWCGDVDHGGDVAASDQTGQDGRGFKVAQCWQISRRVASTCPASTDRRARVTP